MEEFLLAMTLTIVIIKEIKGQKTPHLFRIDGVIFPHTLHWAVNPFISARAKPSAASSRFSAVTNCYSGIITHYRQNVKPRSYSGAFLNSRTISNCLRKASAVAWSEQSKSVAKSSNRLSIESNSVIALYCSSISSCFNALLALESLGVGISGIPKCNFLCSVSLGILTLQYQ